MKSFLLKLLRMKRISSYYLFWLKVKLSVNRKLYQDDCNIIICGLPRSGTSLLFNIISGITSNFRPFTGKSNGLSSTKEISFRSKILSKGSYITKQPDDIFLINEMENWNLRKKKVIVLICVRDFRDVLVSKHQSYPDNYYIGYNWKTNLVSGRNKKVGIKNYVEEIINVKDLKIDNCSKYIIKYEELTNDPDLIAYILSKNGVNINRKAEKYFEHDELPYSSEQKISKGIESKGVIKNSNKWKNNDNDKKYVIDNLKKYPDLKKALSFFNYT